MTSDAHGLKSKDMQNWQKKLPMQLTMSRVYVVPVILLMMWPKTLIWNIAAAILFILSSITDYYDGHFARKFGAVSTMGKFMDPVTDKILVSSVLIALTALGKVDPYLVVILLARDTLIGGIRSIAATDQVVIAAKASGKWKTGLQMGAIPAVMIADFHLSSYCCSPIDWSHWRSYLHLVGWVGYILLWGSVILSLTSGYEYFQIFKSQSKISREKL